MSKPRISASISDRLKERLDESNYNVSGLVEDLLEEFFEGPGGHSGIQFQVTQVENEIDHIDDRIETLARKRERKVEEREMLLSQAEDDEEERVELLDESLTTLDTHLGGGQLIGDENPVVRQLAKEEFGGDYDEAFDALEARNTEADVLAEWRFSAPDGGPRR